MTKARNWKKAAWITFFVLPGAAIVFIFILLPLFMSLFNSFFSWNQLIPGRVYRAGKLFRSCLPAIPIRNALQMLWVTT